MSLQVALIIKGEKLYSLLLKVRILVRRQVVVIVSIALVFFLVGMLFSMASTAIGIIPNPFGNYLSTLEQVKVVRFSQPDEVNVTNGYHAQVATFVWTPSNPKNNSILAIYAYCEYRSENPPEVVWNRSGNFWWELEFSVEVKEWIRVAETNYHRITKIAGSQQQWEQEWLAQWEQTAFPAQQKQNAFWIKPDQANYTLTFATYHNDIASSSTPTYVRNINIIMEVLDENQ